MRLGEHDRLLGSMLMIGVVTALDEAQAAVRVDVDGQLTDWIPWLERRAGAAVRMWAPPQAGEQVLLGCPYGDLAQAVVLGSIFSETHDAPASGKDLTHATFADGTIVEYDSATHLLKINVGTGNVQITCQNATVAASGAVTLDAPTVSCTGNVNVSGNVQANGDVKAGSISLRNHKHGGVQVGGSTTGSAI